MIVIPEITALPTPPSKARPSLFADEADAFLGALPTLQSEQNAAITEMNKIVSGLDQTSPTAAWATGVYNFPTVVAGSDGYNYRAIDTTDAADNPVGSVTGDWVKLAVTPTGDQTIAGVKTFTSSPVVPTPTSTDSSTKVASTAFVKAQVASETVKGMVELATSAEVLAGTDTTRAITPAGFNSAILGTVSQSGGAPTGAIIERGSNANGEYIKFADGTLICRKMINFTGQSLVPNGAALIPDTTMPATPIEGSSYLSFAGEMFSAVGTQCYGYFATYSGRVVFANTGINPIESWVKWNEIGSIVVTNGWVSILNIARWF